MFCTDLTFEVKDMGLSQMNTGWPQVHCFSLIPPWQVGLIILKTRKNAKSRNSSLRSLRRHTCIIKVWSKGLEDLKGKICCVTSTEKSMEQVIHLRFHVFYSDYVLIFIMYLEVSNLYWNVPYVYVSFHLSY